MQTAKTPLSSGFLRFLEPLPYSPRVGFLVSLFEARREILIGLDDGVLALPGVELTTEEFEFLLAVNAASRENPAGITPSMLQQELGISIATVHRRIRALCADQRWLKDPRETSGISFSIEGIQRWNRLLESVRKVSAKWLLGCNSKDQSKDLSIHKYILLNLRRKLRSRNFLRSGRFSEEFSDADSIIAHDKFSQTSVLDLLMLLLRIGRQLSYPCEELATRHQLTLHEADILVILALQLSEGIAQQTCLETSQPNPVTNEIGWCEFSEINRQLVHSHRIHASVFSRCIKHLSQGVGNTGLIQIGPWRGRSKAARVTEEGYQRAAELWHEYKALSESWLQAVPDDLVQRGIEIHQQVGRHATELPSLIQTTDFLGEPFLSDASIDPILETKPKTYPLIQPASIKAIEEHDSEEDLPADLARRRVASISDVWERSSTPSDLRRSLKPSRIDPEFELDSEDDILFGSESTISFRLRRFVLNRLRRDNHRLKIENKQLMEMIHQLRIENRTLSQMNHDLKSKHGQTLPSTSKQ